MKKKWEISWLLATVVASILMTQFSAMAADKVVVIPLGSIKPTGDTVAEYVLEGTTFSNNDGVGIEGTMPNVGQQNITPGTNPQTITKGYHDGVPGTAYLIQPLAIIKYAVPGSPLSPDPPPWCRFLPITT